MDAWIRMAWRDPRLRHGYSRPVLINDYTFLKRLWRPDPVFINTKEATFHQVSTRTSSIRTEAGLLLELLHVDIPTWRSVLRFEGVTQPYCFTNCSLQISS